MSEEEFAGADFNFEELPEEVDEEAVENEIEDLEDIEPAGTEEEGEAEEEESSAAEGDNVSDVEADLENAVFSAERDSKKKIGKTAFVPDSAKTLADEIAKSSDPKIRYLPATKRITSPYITKFEKARLIGERAMQLEKDGIIMVPYEEVKDLIDPKLIAEYEYNKSLQLIRRGEKSIFPIKIRRYRPDNFYEDIDISELKTVELK